MLTPAQEATRQRVRDAQTNYDPLDTTFAPDEQDVYLFQQYADQIINHYYADTNQRKIYSSWVETTCSSDPTLLHQMIYSDVTVDCVIDQAGEKVLRATKDGRLVCENRLREFTLSNDLA